MSGCEKYQKLIYEEAVGEISQSNKTALYGHLAVCQECRREREAVVSLNQAFLKQSRKISLAPAAAASMRAEILGRMAVPETKRSLWSRVRSKVVLKGLVPALAAACLVFILLGKWGFQEERQGGHRPQLNKSQNIISEAKISPEELDIINNLELLDQLDTVKLLVKVVDNKDTI